MKKKTFDCVKMKHEIQDKLNETINIADFNGFCSELNILAGKSKFINSLKKKWNKTTTTTKR